MVTFFQPAERCTIQFRRQPFPTTPDNYHILLKLNLYAQSQMENSKKLTYAPSAKYCDLSNSVTCLGYFRTLKEKSSIFWQPSQQQKGAVTPKPTQSCEETQSVPHVWFLVLCNVVKNCFSTKYEQLKHAKIRGTPFS